jgi:hypothetical protein
LVSEPDFVSLGAEQELKCRISYDSLWGAPSTRLDPAGAR